MSKPLEWTTQQRKVNDLVPLDINPRKISESQRMKMIESLQKFNLVDIPVIDTDGTVISGHQRLRALQAIGRGDELIDVRVPNRKLTAKEVKEYNLLANTHYGEFDFDLLDVFSDIDMDIVPLDIKKIEFEQSDMFHPFMNKFEKEKEKAAQPVAQEDDYEPPAEIKTDIVPGDLFEIGPHRLLCGDSTDSDQVAKLMNGEKADMVFTDPPYGINKDIENDNLNPDKLVAFNNEWIINCILFLKDCGYFFIWGYFQVLAETWTKVIRPLEKVGFRNYVIWKKRGKVQGINNEYFRMFPPAYESALVFVWGQQFGNGAWSSTPNAEYYWEGYEPIRLYLDGERKKMGWDIPTIKKMVGHSDLYRDHWFSKSQWSFITLDVYTILQEQSNGKAFRKQYDELRKQYDELRGYFDNTNGYTDIWEFEKETGDDNHPTVKPIELCQRGIISTSKENELILDLFLGSGSTMVASHQLNRKCYGMEIDPKYCQVIIERMLKLDPTLIIKRNGQPWTTPTNS